MRGRDDRGEGMFSYIRLEERVPFGADFDCARDAAAGDVAAGDFLDEVPASTHRTDRLQPLVPLICRLPMLCAFRQQLDHQRDERARGFDLHLAAPAH